MKNSIEVVSSSSSCGTPEASPPLGWTGKFSDLTRPYVVFSYRTAGFCTVTLRAVNGAGPGPSSTVTFW